MSSTAEGVASWSDFAKLDIRVGTILSARLNPRARRPAYVMDIDFGAGIGVKVTSAQITEAYEEESLMGMQVIAIVNLPRKKVAEVWSEVLVLGVVQDSKPTIVLTPASRVENGARIF